MAYIDGIDFEHHLEADALGVEVYPSVADALKRRPHLSSGECGIAKVEIRFVRWARKPKPR